MFKAKCTVSSPKSLFLLKNCHLQKNGYFLLNSYFIKNTTKSCGITQSRQNIPLFHRKGYFYPKIAIFNKYDNFPYFAFYQNPRKTYEMSPVNKPLLFKNRYFYRKLSLKGPQKFRLKIKNIIFQTLEMTIFVAITVVD